MWDIVEGAIADQKAPIYDPESKKDSDGVRRSIDRESSLQYRESVDRLNRIGEREIERAFRTVR